ncbi:MAG: hypothetical protein AAGF97_03235 [Planctomycetota bacterium]
MSNRDLNSADPMEAETTPRPTYAPAAMAMGVMMLLWGIVTMWIMSAAGAGLMVWSLWTWIREISNAAD